MAHTGRIVYARGALDDLQELRSWYEARGAADAGRETVRFVLNRLELLETFPELGRVIPEFEKPHLRELVVPPFRIAYSVRGDTILVLNVWRSERPVPRTLSQAHRSALPFVRRIARPTTGEPYTELPTCDRLVTNRHQTSSPTSE